ncbi:organomercurial lyase [Mycetocola miduiensis]|uniref:Alkylmercury lyase n=1 Tax=Mycetocola miduiensis TaxID=995034 RepID=A0A1I5B662_9MICO|nr:organomercurial lyase [Mycetocola miduiensis]SFN70100.1 Alkylmercury lyase [Mycetocola miduiensis]
MADLETTAESVRLAVYRHLAESGLAPTRETLTRRLGLTAEQVDTAFRELAAARHLVLGSRGEIVLAHPFATRNFAFSVMGERVLWWGGCAWDAFAIPHLVKTEPSVLVATMCPDCATPHAWTVGTDAPPLGNQVAHFLVPTTHIWDDVVHACSNQRIFCSERCVDDWLARTGNARGSVFDLPTLWRLASGWYEGRLHSPYRRREPAEAHAYFRKAGLRGAFWGLDDDVRPPETAPARP